MKSELTPGLYAGRHAGDLILNHALTSQLLNVMVILPVANYTEEDFA